MRSRIRAIGSSRRPVRPVSTPPSARDRVLTHPRGIVALVSACAVVFCVVHAAAAAQGGRAAPANRIINTTLNVADLDRAMIFFSRGLGMHERGRRSAGPGVTEVSIGYSDDPRIPELMLVERRAGSTSPAPGGTPPAPGGWGRVILEVKDINAIGESVVMHGGTLIRGARKAPSAPVITAIVEDPDGHRFELVQYQ